jgi:hypothetical protein
VKNSYDRYECNKLLIKTEICMFMRYGMQILECYNVKACTHIQLCTLFVIIVYKSFMIYSGIL